MITRRYLEKKSTVLGLPMYQLGLLVLAMVIMIVVSSLLKLATPQYRWFNHLTVVVVAGGYFLLRYAAGRRHPSYLASLLSFKLLQRRRCYQPTAGSIMNALQPLKSKE
jgi:hypothetical protein